ncbi:ATP-binding cassette domain-containing protein (plasmid) [Phaeobacter sp. BS23]|uniref:ABC transporter ATP-binding protein n=1 Tax=Phaeobacter sp. BS23 TaxID=2907239 RepID=UPI003865785B
MAEQTNIPPDVFVRRLIKTYPGETTPTLKDLTLTCPAGKITVVVGPSGCGKSTLLRCICGLEGVTSGSIHFGDREVTQVDAERRGVAMVFQNYALYPDKTVAENIAFPLRMAKVPAPEREQRVAAAARLVRIEDFLHRRPANLSGGQRQRVGIARAIVRGPDVLLMDEPLSNLDTKLRAEMRAELGAMQKSIGATTFYVTHDQTEALTLADHLIILHDGIVAQQGTPMEVFQTPASEFVADFLGRMNLLRGRRAGKTLHLDTGENLALPEGFADTPEVFTLGFRAEEASLDATADGLNIKAAVEHIELLGTENLISARIGDAVFRVRAPVGVAVTDQIDARIKLGDIHLFDENGNRL